MPMICGLLVIIFGVFFASVGLYGGCNLLIEGVHASFDLVSAAECAVGVAMVYLSVAIFRALREHPVQEGISRRQLLKQLSRPVFVPVFTGIMGAASTISAVARCVEFSPAWPQIWADQKQFARVICYLAVVAISLLLPLAILRYKSALSSVMRRGYGVALFCVSLSLPFAGMEVINRCFYEDSDVYRNSAGRFVASWTRVQSEITVFVTGVLCIFIAFKAVNMKFTGDGRAATEEPSAPGADSAVS